ncbi:uncharacterized protein [Arachis hypogaea]|uniref:uncharacterized protein n=1 Tax=Arachis hypogaea TaxID=3818 RepID=UPI003B21B2FF
MVSYETLYGRKCQSPLYWYEAGEASVLGPDLIAEITENIKQIRARILTAQSRQKSYSDQRRKLLEFEAGEHVFLKVTPTTRIGRAIKMKKLNPRLMMGEMSLGLKVCADNNACTQEMTDVIRMMYDHSWPSYKKAPANIRDRWRNLYGTGNTMSPSAKLFTIGWAGGCNR